MGPLTTSTTVTPVVDAFFDKKLLRRAVPRTFLQRLGQRRSLPGMSTKTIRFRRLEAFGLAQTPLSEGLEPTASTPDTTDVSASILQWGAYVKHSDILEATIEHPVINDIVRAQAEQAARTTEANIRDEVSAGTSVFYGNAESSRSALVGVSHAATASLFDKVTRYLDGNDAGYFTEMYEASTKISTRGIRPSFYGLTHPDVVFTLRHLSGWQDISEYPSNDGVMEGEVGSINGVRILSSTLAKVYRGGGGTAVGDVKSMSTAADVYTILVFAMDAFGVVPLNNMSLEAIIHPVGSAGAAVPLNQWGTVGWKYTGTQTILNDSFMTRIEVTARDASPV
jgi:N4-gp56 family major capsid protein